MNRFFVEPDHITGKDITFPADLTHQILHVLRLKEGDLVEVLDNLGHGYRVALVVNTAQNHVLGEIQQEFPLMTEPKVQITLYFGLSSREKIEWILQKGTEVGVSAFSPFISQRTLVRPSTFPENRRARWEKIIREAAEQSGRGHLPELNSPKALETCFYDARRLLDLNLIAWEGATQDDQQLNKNLIGFKGKTIGLFVGPEGGFSEDEIRQAEQVGLQVVSLGKRILRMETAAIIFPALILFALQDY
jgi:16S rRNA (uracil1498-N3)-methyltransferase